MPPAAYQVFGVVRAGTPAPDGTELLTDGELAALVAACPPGPLRATPQRLLAHARVLDSVAATDPVLPVRFGTVLPSAEAVVAQLLAPQRPRLVAALASLAGRAQFTVGARYLPDQPVRQVLDEQPALRRLHARLHRRGAAPDPASRMRLGEAVARAVTVVRQRDTAALAAALRPHAVRIAVQPSSSLESDRVADVAVLVEHTQAKAVEAVVEDLARRWADRIRLRLLGPMAPYHFTGAAPTGGGR